jgi:PmbA protein
MSRQLLDKAHEVVRAARRLGAQDVRATVNRNRTSGVEWRDGKLDRIRESTSMGVAITLFVDGRYSQNSTSDLRSAALESFLAETIAATRLLATDPFRRLPDPSRYANRYAGDLVLFDGPGASSVTGIDRRRVAQTLEDGARSAPGADRIIAVQARCSDSLYEQALVNSNGMEGDSAATVFSTFATATLRGEGDRRPMDYAYAATLRRGDLPDPAAIGAAAVTRASSMIGQAPMASGRYPCVIENRVVERALEGLLEPLNGNLIQQKQSFLADKLGQAVAGELFTIIDDPFVVSGFGSGTYDDEGMSTYRRPIFERGVLRGFYLSTYYANKLNLPPTSGSQTNLIFESGARDLDGLLQAMGTGILVTDFVGGNSNSTTGDFSVGIRGQWVENGRRVRPVAEMNLSGNHLAVWKQVAELGNDPWPYSSVRCPSLRFGELEFAGS